MSCGGTAKMKGLAPHCLIVGSAYDLAVHGILETCDARHRFSLTPHHACLAVPFSACCVRTLAQPGCAGNVAAPFRLLLQTSNIMVEKGWHFPRHIFEPLDSICCYTSVVVRRHVESRQGPRIREQKDRATVNSQWKRRVRIADIEQMSCWKPQGSQETGILYGVPYQY